MTNFTQYKTEIAWRSYLNNVILTSEETEEDVATYSLDC